MNRYLVGNTVVMRGTCNVVDPATGDETPTDPTSLTFIRILPDGTRQDFTWPAPPSPEITKLGTGDFTCTVEVEDSGTEKWRYETEGACTVASEDIFEVVGSSVV